MITKTNAKVKVNLQEDKEILLDAISALKKSMAAHKKERKAEWMLFKNKFKKDMENIKKTLKIMVKDVKK
jgi:hypothetical protein